MKLKTWIALGITTVACAGAASADKKAEMDAMMQACMAAATPGAVHQHLATMAGNWDTVVKSWDDPSAPPTETKGTAKMSMVMGGRYLLQEFHGEMMGMPYEGMGYTGFDNVQQKFVSTWMDNMSTGIMYSVGQASADNKTLSLVGKSFDPMSKQEMTFDETLTFVSDNHHMFEMWMPGPDGKKIKMMEIHYNRKM